jgi:hypothetical protein
MCAKTLFFRSFLHCNDTQIHHLPKSSICNEFHNKLSKNIDGFLELQISAAPQMILFVASMFVICVLDPIFPFLKKIGSCQFAEFDAGEASNQVKHCCNGFAPMEFLSIFH